MNELEFKIPLFEGPMELLLELLEKNKIDIYDIPIADICDQFIAYIADFSGESIEIMGEFLSFASELVEIKSKMLLPISANTDASELELLQDPRADLVKRLLEYKKVKLMSAEISRRGEIYYSRMSRDERISEKDYEFLKSDIESADIAVDIMVLVEALSSLMERVPEKDIFRENFFKNFDSIRKKYISVEDKINRLISLFSKNKSKRVWTISEIIENSDRSEMIATFLAILELFRLATVDVKQEHNFSEITLHVNN